MKSCILPRPDGPKEGKNADHRRNQDPRIDRRSVIKARSPAMANALLQRRGRSGEYVLAPMNVASDGLAEFVFALRHLRNFGGAIVSMPHKTAIVQLLDELTPKRSWSAQ